MKYETDLSQVELAKRLKVIKGITKNDDDFEKIKGDFVAEEHYPRINGIINGMSQEDEFSILCVMMDRCGAITGLDQTPLIDRGEKTSDFLMSFYPSQDIFGCPPNANNVYNCMVEIKSTIKSKLKISRSDLKKRISFAKRFNLPLIYAVRFTSAKGYALWAMVNAEKLLIDNKVTPNHVVEGISTVLFDNYSVTINQSYTIQKTYRKDKVDSLAFHKEYGGLESITLHNENGHSYTLSGNDAFIFSLLFEVYITQSSYVETYKGTSNIYSNFNTSQTVFLTDILYAAVNVMDYGEHDYDPIRLISKMDSESNKTVLPNRSLFDDLFTKINENCKNFFFFGLIGDPNKQFAEIFEIPEEKGT